MDFEYISQKLKAQHPLEIMIDFEEKDMMLKAPTYATIASLEREIKQHAIIAETISAATMMSSLNWKLRYDTKEESSVHNFKVVDRTTEFAISWLVKPFFLFFQGKANVEGRENIFSYYRSQMQQLFSPSGKHTRVGCRLRDDSPQKILTLQKQLQPIFRKYERSLKAKIYCTGYSLLIANTATSIYRTQYTSVLLGTVLIAVLFLIVIRSLLLTCLALFVNAMSLVGIISVFVICGFDITLYSVILLAGLLGVMVDDTIHFIVHFNYYCKCSENFDNITAITLQKVKPAIFSSSLILMCGFSVFFLSQLSVYYSFAFLFQMGIILALFWDCYVLPELIHLVTKK